MTNGWLGGASNNGGIVLQWLQEEFFRSKENVPDFLNQAVSVEPGSGGLIFLPYLLGERAPVWNANAKGILFGLQINHDQAAMVRASLEGVIYCLYAISQPLFEHAEIRKIYATGGFARNELWLQILADVFNLPVLVCETTENSAWGAAKFGMQALGIPVSHETRITQKINPDISAHLVYAKGLSDISTPVRIAERRISIKKGCMEIHPYNDCHIKFNACRGHGRDRTAVKGFADPCLTTRPHDQIRMQ